MEQYIAETNLDPVRLRIQLNRALAEFVFWDKAAPSWDEDRGRGQPKATERDALRAVLVSVLQRGGLPETTARIRTREILDACAVTRRRQGDPKELEREALRASNRHRGLGTRYAVFFD
jgi:hypothetical protein